MAFRGHAEYCIAGLAVLLVAHLANAGQSGTRSGLPDRDVSQVQDVSLTAGRNLVGRVLDRQGRPAPYTVVLLRSEREKTAGRVQADASGRFAFGGLRGGLYELRTPDSRCLLRVWSPGSAPSQARNEAVLFSGAAVRGQLGGGHYNGMFLRALSHPGIVSGLTAAAIAIPIAVDDNDAS